MDDLNQDLSIQSWFYLKKTQKFLHLQNPIKAYEVSLFTIKDLITGYETKLTESIDNIIQQLNSSPGYKVWHFMYEYGEVKQEIKTREKNPILFYFIHYKSAKKLKINSYASFQFLKLKNEISKTVYNALFKKVFSKLEAGHAYQINLTSRSEYFLEKKLHGKDVYKVLKSFNQSLSSYAHASYLGPCSKAIISNSPECLWEIKKNGQKWRVTTRPIKGTYKIGANEDKKKVFRKFYQDAKNTSELSIITDLLRNDLNKLSGLKAKVDKIRSPLFLQSIVHQYSQVSALLDSRPQLIELLNSLFPGGSITGAPKKRVMEIIRQTELHNRGIYTGSTVLEHEGISIASINIRTLTLHMGENIADYGAGGGITLLSEQDDEFDEMILKRNSILNQFIKN